MITIAEIVQLVFYAVVLLLLTPPLGKLMAKIFEGEKTFLSPVVGWLERLTYKLSGIDPNEEMNWKTYMWAMLAFNFFGFTVVFLLQFFQSHLPLNPQQLADVSWHLAFNTAVSFMTNTNWQSYAGEVTLSYFV
ncbi:MAG: potassium-transporting ATPase subunit KdpA, partial [Bacteriovoracaceae bacterium]